MAENRFADGYDTEGHLNVRQSAVRSLNANSAHVEQTAVQRLAAESVVADNSAAGIVNGTNVELRESAAGIVAGDYVRIEESRVFLLLTPRLSGNVKAFLTLPAAFAMGAGYFVARTLTKSLLEKRRS
jgi:hypothetical protein